MALVGFEVACHRKTPFIKPEFTLKQLLSGRILYLVGAQVTEQIEPPSPESDFKAIEGAIHRESHDMLVMPFPNHHMVE